MCTEYMSGHTMMAEEVSFFGGAERCASASGASRCCSRSRSWRRFRASADWALTRIGTPLSAKSLLCSSCASFPATALPCLSQITQNCSHRGRLKCSGQLMRRLACNTPAMSEPLLTE